MSAAMFSKPVRRKAEREVQVCELAQRIESWMRKSDSRDIVRLMRRLKSEATWKTAPTIVDGRIVYVFLPFHSRNMFYPN